VPLPVLNSVGFSRSIWHRTSGAVILAGLVSLLLVGCSSDGAGAPDGATPTTPGPTSVFGETPSPAATADTVAGPTEGPLAGPTPSTPGRGATPKPTSTSGGSATTPATSEPTPEGKSGELTRIGDAVSEIRELHAGGDPNVSLVGKDRIAEELAEDLADPEVLADIADREVLLKLLGLIPQDSDLLEIERNLLEGAVIGLYNHETGELLVLGGGEEVSVKEEAVYSHEYAHLLQDVNFDLSVLFEDAKNDSDREGALQAMIEGEATFVEAIYAARNFAAEDLNELITVDPIDLAILEATPDFLVLTLGWPYTAGFGFVNSIWQGGGMAGLDAAWADLPETTEQIIHPEKYRTNEYPETPPTLPDMASILGEGWSVQSEDVLGEAIISLWLEALGVEAAVAARAAAGWGSDGYLLLDGPVGEIAMGLLIEWDDPGTDGLQFSAAFEGALDADAAFSRITVGDATIARWTGPGGTMAFALDAATGAAGLAVAPTLDAATALLDALVDG